MLLFRLQIIDVYKRQQAETAGKRYQDGCGQDTDAGKSRSILLHPVNHPRNGNKIFRFIIKSLVFAERFQQSDAPRLKQTIGADDHENHRREKGKKSVGSRIGCLLYTSEGAAS